MATVNFYIRKSTTKYSDSGAIFLKYNDVDQQFTHTLDFEIAVKNWNADKGRLKSGNDINLELDAIAVKILRIRKELVDYDVDNRLIRPLAKDIKAQYLGTFEIQPPQSDTDNLSEEIPTIIDLLQRFIDDPDREIPLTPKTIQNYITTIRHLRLFNQHGQYKIVSLDLADIDSKFFVKVKRFLTDDKVRGGLQLKNGTVNKHLSCVKAAMRYFKDEYQMDIKMLEGVKKLESQEDIHFCSYEELEQLKLIEFEGFKMALAVKLYIFACYAPARYSDLGRLKSHHLLKSQDKQGNPIHVLDFVSSKTGVRTIIPLNNYCVALIKELRKGDKLLPVPANISKLLHGAFNLSGLFDEYVTKRVYRGTNRPVEVSKQRWEVLNFHTSRDTFGSNMIALGESIYHVSSALGHKKIETTMKYVHLMKSAYYSSILERQGRVEVKPQLKIIKSA